MLPFLDHDASSKNQKLMKFTWLKRFYNGLSAIFVRRQFLQVLGRLKQVQLGLKE